MMKMSELNGIPPTHPIYYKQAYVKEFGARVIKILKMETAKHLLLRKIYEQKIQVKKGKFR
jgi:hypothetical protein